MDKQLCFSFQHFIRYKIILFVLHLELLSFNKCT